jgi:small subunit ribosomal protein S9
MATAKETAAKPASAKAVKTFNATGRRKTSSARVTIAPARAGEEGDASAFVVNKKTLDVYFPSDIDRMLVMQPFSVTERTGAYTCTVNVRGGGKSGQAGAIILGVARALQLAEPDLHDALKKAGLLTRDPRAVERKKPGRHKARKRPQFSKR